MIFFGLKMDVVRFASELQLLSESVWQSTTITRVGKSAVCSVSIATDTLSVSTVEDLATACSLQLTNIWFDDTPAKLSLRR